MKALDNKKRALVGYVAWRLASRYLSKRRKRERRGSKIAVYVTLGVVSLGLLAGLAYYWRRSGEAGDMGEAAEEAAADVAETATEDAGAAANTLAEASDDATAQAESVGNDVAQAIESATT